MDCPQGKHTSSFQSRAPEPNGADLLSLFPISGHIAPTPVESKDSWIIGMVLGKQILFLIDTRNSMSVLTQCLGPLKLPSLLLG
jgi:hypothetical protein